MSRTFEEDQFAEDLGHYIRRARLERELAIKAPSDKVADAHLERARRYEALIANGHDRSCGDLRAADCDSDSFTMSSQRIFPFFVRRTASLVTART